MGILNRQTRSGVTLLFLGVLAATGCGPAARTEPVAKLEGTVTINGKPLPDHVDASIVFRGSGKSQAPPTQVKIEAGRYRTEKAPMGNVSAIFNITQLTGKIITEDEHSNPERINLVPEKARNGIPLDVKGANAQQDFDLK